MVEPAIAITAAAIATLRPLFKNFLSFGSKGFANDSETSFAELVRASGESRVKSPRSGESYTAEFAEMLGLRGLGVKTTVTAGKSPTWWEKRTIARTERRERWIDNCKNQADLNYVKEMLEVPEWKIRVQTSVVIND
jgi:hypothetical protein